jgi:hypothetical protein
MHVSNTQHTGGQSASVTSGLETLPNVFAGRKRTGWARLSIPIKLKDKTTEDQQEYDMEWRHQAQAHRQVSWLLVLDIRLWLRTHCAEYMVTFLTLIGLAKRGSMREICRGQPAACHGGRPVAPFEQLEFRCIQWIRSINACS